MEPLTVPAHSQKYKKMLTSRFNSAVWFVTSIIKEIDVSISLIVTLFMRNYFTFVALKNYNLQNSP